eukprot:6475513-Amphidinium_carterae.1
MALQQLGMQPQQEAALQAEIQRLVDEGVEQRVHELGAAGRPPSSRMMDTKLGKPPEFHGQIEKWEEFSFKLESFLSAMDPAMGTLLQSVRGDVERERPLSGQSDRDKELSTQMYFALVMVCKDCALNVVRLSERNNGVEAYRLLLRRYDPRTRTRGLTRLSKIINPQWPADGGLLDAIISWEKEIKDYEALTRDNLSDAMKCAVLTEHAPEHVKTYLLLNAGVDLDFARLRLVLEGYLQARQQDDPKPMEVDAITKGKSKGKGDGKRGGKPWTYKGDGKGKSKDKGKYQGSPQGASQGGAPPSTAEFPGYCRKCGKWGHKAALCKSGGKGGKKGVSVVLDGTDTGVNSSEGQDIVGTIVLSDEATRDEFGWIAAVVGENTCTQVLVDSGAVLHVCGKGHFK